MFAYHKVTLPNGLRIISIPKNDSPSTTVMVIVGVGSRDEKGEQSGIAHFIEHNVFKGTSKRTKPNQVVYDIESVGGETNAGTSNEYTYFWAKSASAFASKILDVILDISLHMTFPQKDLEIERGNVIEEINMYEDNPMQKVMTEYIELVWGDHPLGRKISGTKETVSSISREDMVSFVQDNYTPEKKIVIISGGGDHQGLIEQVTDAFDSVPSRGPGKLPLAYDKVQDRFLINVTEREIGQTHLCVGFRSCGRNDERRFACEVANAILGEGMSSRLFFRIREELGLAYYVGSGLWEHDETGMWIVRAGVDTNRIDEALQSIAHEFTRLRTEKVTDTELRRAKEYIKGKTLLSTETSDDLGEWYGFQELLEKTVITPEEYNSKIEEVSVDNVLDIAREFIHYEKMSVGIIGPYKEGEKDRFEKVLSDQFSSDDLL